MEARVSVIRIQRRFKVQAPTQSLFDVTRTEVTLFLLGYLTWHNLWQPSAGSHSMYCCPTRWCCHMSALRQLPWHRS
jgi:hypothetical protein